MICTMWNIARDGCSYGLEDILSDARAREGLLRRWLLWRVWMIGIHVDCVGHWYVKGCGRGISMEARLWQQVIHEYEVKVDSVELLRRTPLLIVDKSPHLPMPVGSPRNKA
jgi:hypothetical protein